MKLRIGDSAPQFEVTARQGGKLRSLGLADFAGQKNVVLFFYPRDFTTVCTREACGFRDMYEDLIAQDTELIGVSADDAASHERFAREHHLAYPLVADPRRALAKLYGATSLLSEAFGVTARVTFVIDKRGRIAGIFDSRFSAREHLEGVQRTLAAQRVGHGHAGGHTPQPDRASCPDA